MSTQLASPLPQPPTLPISPPAANDEPPQKRRLYCVTICGYRKPTLTEAECVHYMTHGHAELCKGFMAKYGTIRWTHAHNTAETRALMPVLYEPEFARTHEADFDFFSQAVFEDLDHFLTMKQDPLWQDSVRKDTQNFADVARTRVTIGWFDEYISNGKTL